DRLHHPQTPVGREAALLLRPQKGSVWRGEQSRPQHRASVVPGIEGPGAGRQVERWEDSDERGCQPLLEVVGADAPARQRIVSYLRVREDGSAGVTCPGTCAGTGVKRSGAGTAAGPDGAPRVGGSGEGPSGEGPSGAGATGEGPSGTGDT